MYDDCPLNYKFAPAAYALEMDADAPLCGLSLSRSRLENREDHSVWRCFALMMAYLHYFAKKRVD